MPYVKYAKNRIWTSDVMCALYILRESEFDRLELSDYERAVARCVLDGDDNALIAKKLRLSKPGVDYHLRKVYDKSGPRTRNEFARLMRARIESSERSWENAADLRKEGRSVIADLPTKVKYGLVSL